jgi:hypothetical protein
LKTQDRLNHLRAIIKGTHSILQQKNGVYSFVKGVDINESPQKREQRVVENKEKVNKAFEELLKSHYQKTNQLYTKLVRFYGALPKLRKGRLPNSGPFSEEKSRQIGVLVATAIRKLQLENAEFYGKYIPTMGEWSSAKEKAAIAEFRNRVPGQLPTVVQESLGEESGFLEACAITKKLRADVTPVIRKWEETGVFPTTCDLFVKFLNPTFFDAETEIPSQYGAYVSAAQASVKRVQDARAASEKRVSDSNASWFPAFFRRGSPPNPDSDAAYFLNDMPDIGGAELIPPDEDATYGKTSNTFEQLRRFFGWGVDKAKTAINSVASRFLIDRVVWERLKEESGLVGGGSREEYSMNTVYVNLFCAAYNYDIFSRDSYTFERVDTDNYFKDICVGIVEKYPGIIVYPEIKEPSIQKRVIDYGASTIMSPLKRQRFVSVMDGGQRVEAAKLTIDFKKSGVIRGGEPRADSK